MFGKIVHTLKYHNAVPVALGVVFLGAGAAFASSPAARDAVLSSATTVRSVDNSYLLAADLISFDPKLTITAVVEDASFYHVSYSYRTIAIVDYVWRDIERMENLAVSKAALGDEDLGVFVARELGEVVEQRGVYLAEAQGIERAKGETAKVATIEYAGLVGKLLDPKVTVFDGYVPVKEEVAVAEAERPAEPAGVSSDVVVSQDSAAAPSPSREEIRAFVAEAVREILESGAVSQTAAVAAADASAAEPTASSDTTPLAVSDVEPPVITLLGNNPATINVGTAYSDLGATVTDNVNDNLGYRVSVDGKELPEVSIDTSAAGEHVITYTTTDQAGNTATATRTVIVVGPASAEPVAESAPVAQESSEPVEPVASSTPSSASTTPDVL